MHAQLHLTDQAWVFPTRCILPKNQHTCSPGPQDQDPVDDLDHWAKHRTQPWSSSRPSVEWIERRAMSVTHQRASLTDIFLVLSVYYYIVWRLFCIWYRGEDICITVCLRFMNLVDIVPACVDHRASLKLVVVDAYLWQVCWDLFVLDSSIVARFILTVGKQVTAKTLDQYLCAGPCIVAIFQALRSVGVWSVDASWLLTSTTPLPSICRVKWQAGKAAFDHSQITAFYPLTWKWCTTLAETGAQIVGQEG